VRAGLLVSCGIVIIVVALLNFNFSNGLLEDMCISGAEDVVRVCMCMCLYVCVCVCVYVQEWYRGCVVCVRERK